MSAIAAADVLPIMADASAERGTVVVSVHDVAPATRAACERIIDGLSAAGVQHTSLLVVPDYHHRGSAMADRGFVEWLRHLEAGGHEVVIHGYFHQRPARDGESLRDSLITRYYTRGEGEFYDLDYAEAARRIVQARDEFRAAGFAPVGFIAPAWLLSEAARPAIRDADLEYTTLLDCVIDVRQEQRYASRSLVYSTANFIRQTSSLAWNWFLAQALASKPLVRLGIHPPDVADPPTWRQIQKLARRFAETRMPRTYRDFIAERRAAAANAL